MKITPPSDTTAPTTPRHVAIIMDGNGRWAHQRGLSRSAGHRRGAQSVKTAIDCAIEVGVEYLTLFGFSSENWRRPESEVTDLMGLLRFYLKHEIEFLRERQVRFRMIGDRSRLASDIVNLVDRAEAETTTFRRLTLIIALSYGGRAEIALAARRLAEKAVDGTLSPAAIDESAIADHLDTRDIPDPDLLVRTSGEQRISNFLLWQTAYSEFVFLETLWPDFSRRDFQAAVQEFRNRERRYGAVVV